ncbi:hypothetical protein PGTUg99_018046 [Puccinia graminis f. sp. tritici]|uniref:Uncharacterized protein n=1 Tax=Puccinia graminis f. sp. tritici TaxID=56615 RepID=A0A5B0S0F7_PUCGR|nr:hypothetical protein PGTUg99_018046 [Puccinia graminis f. sp. tritici]
MPCQSRRTAFHSGAQSKLYKPLTARHKLTYDNLPSSSSQVFRNQYSVSVCHSPSEKEPLAFFAPTTRHLVEIRRNQPDRLKDAIDRDRSIESSQHRSGNILAPPLEAQSLGAIRGWNDFIVASQAKAANQPGPDNYASVPTWYCGKLLTSLKGGDLPHLYVQLLLFTHPELVEYIILHILRSHPSQLFQIHESSVQLDEGDSSPSPVVLSGSPFPSNIQV